MRAWNKKKKPRYQRTFSLIFVSREFIYSKSQYVIKNRKVRIIRTLEIRELGE